MNKNTDIMTAQWYKNPCIGDIYKKTTNMNYTQFVYYITHKYIGTDTVI